MKGSHVKEALIWKFHGNECLTSKVSLSKGFSEGKYLLHNPVCASTIMWAVTSCTDHEI